MFDHLSDRLFLGHLAHRPSLDVKHEFARSAAQRDVRALSLARSVHDTAHHRHGRKMRIVHRQRLQRILHLARHAQEIDLRPPARRTARDRRTRRTEPERAENLQTDLHLLLRLRRERHAHRVADAFRKEDSERHGITDRSRD